MTGVANNDGISAPQSLIVDTGSVPSGRLAVTYHTAAGWSYVYSVRPDGTGLTQLTPDGEWAVAPKWSPDGARIAYERDGNDDVAGIWIMRADGSGPARVAPRGSLPFWLDDARVGYGCAAGICVVGADGSRPATLVARQTPPGAIDDSFTLSPDGSTFAFVRHIPNEDFETSRVYVMSRDGTRERELTPPGSAVNEYFPAWAGDSRRIAFLGPDGITVATVDGNLMFGVSNAQRIVPSIGRGGPAWSPDGTRIVFGDEAYRFYIANADGSGSIRRVKLAVSEGPLKTTNARWSWAPR